MMTSFSPTSMWVVMPLRTWWSPKDFFKSLTSITLTQPPFQLAQQPGEDQHQHQVDAGRSDERKHLIIGAGGNGLGEVEQLLTADDAEEGGILEQNDELVAQGGQNGLNGLGMTTKRMVSR